MEHHKKKGMWMRHFLSMPFIWMMLVPIGILHILMEIYHNICFRLYGIPLVKSKEYIKMDRYKLPYLSNWDKINCAYCEYSNGVLHYAARIAGDTEKYWCGIKHEKQKGFHEPSHHKDFIRYGDEKAYKKYNKSCKLQKKK